MSVNMANYKLMVELKNLNRIVEGRTEKVGLFSTLNISNIDLIKDQSIMEVKKIVNDNCLTYDSNTLMIFISLYENEIDDLPSEGVTLYKESYLRYYFSLIHYKFIKYISVLPIINKNNIPIKIIND